LPREETTPPVMNTYRAMGFTGYRFKNDSATEKFIFQNFFVQKVRVAKFKQKKTGGRLASAGDYI
jgi:hypothetical protein